MKKCINPDCGYEPTKEEIIKGYNQEKLELNERIEQISFDLGRAKNYNLPENGREETLKILQNRQKEIDEILIKYNTIII